MWLAVTLALVARPTYWANASADPALRDVLSRIESQAGVPVGSYHLIRRQIAADGTITTSDTYRIGRDFRTVSRQNGMTSAWGQLDGQRWYQDANGFVSVSKVGASDPFNLALRDTARSPTSAIAMTMVSGRIVLDIRPQPGLEQRQYYDAHTYLLTREETHYRDGRVTVTQFSDYRRIFDHWVAFNTEDTSAGTSSTTRILRYDAVTADPTRVAIPTSRVLFVSDVQRSVDVPATFTGDGIVVRSSISGRGLDFMLDSGSPSMVIDAKVAGELALRTILGTPTLTVVAPQITMGQLRATNVIMEAIAKNESLPDGRRIVGLLGCDFIGSGLLLVDYRTKVVSFLPKLPANLASDGWSMLPMDLDRCLPTVPLTVGAVTGSFLLDLGSTSTILGAGFFRRSGAKAIPGVQSGQGSVYRRGVVTEMRIGALLLRDVGVVVPIEGRKDYYSFDGILGRDILSNLAMIFDYGNRALYFKWIGA